MAETRHIRLDYEEALNAKKQLLNSQLNLLHIGKRMKAYKVLRKKELALKRILRTEMKNLRAELNLVLSSFPERSKEKIPQIKQRGRKEEGRSMEEELDEIKNRLERLSK